MRTPRVARVSLIVLFASLWGCSGGGGSHPPANITISLSPAGSRIPINGSQLFTANVTGTTATATTWKVVEGALGGSIDASGSYTAPAKAGTYHVTATSVADTSKSATVAVVVHPTLSVSVASAILNLLETRTFTATVNGTTNTKVTWSVQSAGAGGTVTSAGVYTAPNVPGNITLIATCQADPQEKATIDITVQAGSASGTIN